MQELTTTAIQEITENATEAIDFAIQPLDRQILILSALPGGIPTEAQACLDKCCELLGHYASAPALAAASAEASRYLGERMAAPPYKAELGEISESDVHVNLVIHLG